MTLGTALLCLKEATEVANELENATVNKDGKTWLQLSADDCSSKVLEVWNAKLSPTRARRALQNLVDAGLLLREQGLSDSFDKTYYYSVPDNLTKEGKLKHKGALESTQQSAETNRQLRTRARLTAETQ